MEEEPKLPSLPDEEPRAGEQKKVSSPAPVNARPAGTSFSPKKSVIPEDQFSVPPNVAQGDWAAPAQESFFKELLWSKRFWLGMVLLAVFFYFTTAVPVAKIPLLRTLVEAMGYTEPETHQISFFKALLTWNEHSKSLAAQAADEWQARYSAAAAATGALESAQQTPGVLFDFKEINRARREQGKEAEVLQRTGLVEQSKEAQLVKMSGQETQVNTQTSGNDNTRRGSVAAPKVGEEIISAEVFFGEEEGKIVRDANSGFDSTKQLANVKSPGVIDSSSQDWKMNEADSFWARHRGVVFNNKLFNVGDISRVQGQNVLTVVDVKPRADLVYAWMTSRAGRRTRNLALKQTFSKAGFMGADLSRPMLLSAVDGTGVLPMDADKMRTDFNIAEDRVELEMECDAVLDANQKDVVKEMQQASEKRDELPGTLDNCKTVMDGFSDFKTKLGEIATLCESVKGKYDKMKSACRMKIIVGKCKDKNQEILAIAENLQNDCKTEFYKYFDQQKKDASGNLMYDVNGNPIKYTAQESYELATKEILTDDRKKEIKGNINDKMNLNPAQDEGGSAESYFSQVDWVGTLQNRKYDEQVQ